MARLAKSGAYFRGRRLVGDTPEPVRKALYEAAQISFRLIGASLLRSISISVALLHATQPLQAAVAAARSLELGFILTDTPQVHLAKLQWLPLRCHKQIISGHQRNVAQRFLGMAWTSSSSKLSVAILATRTLRSISGAQPSLWARSLVHRKATIGNFSRSVQEKAVRTAGLARKSLDLGSLSLVPYLRGS